MSPPVHDSILNFYEMWDSGTPAIGKSVLNKSGDSFYLEINEDFNLNLKLNSETLDDTTKANGRLLSKVALVSTNKAPMYCMRSILAF